MSADPATFELLRKRLAAAATQLRERATRLNTARLAAWGRTDSRVLARLSARTEHNCKGRDLVRVGELLLFGYQVMLGLKRETEVGDVFALYRLHESGEGTELLPVPLEGSFLADSRFLADFRELFTYYKAAALEQLRVTPEKLYLIFRLNSSGDRRVLRFALERGGNTDGAVVYLDNRGERELPTLPRHDFDWQPVGREAHVTGRHSHINIADTIFVETIGGDLTIKVENNTETGLGIYSEPVEDQTQSLADAEVAWAETKGLILLRVKPYREHTVRYLIYNKRLQQVQRCDAIGDACVQLPEDQGLVFPGGCYLESGELKRYDELGHDFRGQVLKRVIRSPNGEDLLYVFYRVSDGSYALLAYNLIARTMAPPLVCAGYARYADGHLLIATPEGSEPSRLHSMQLWQTPFFDEEHAAQRPRPKGLLGRIGNASVVRALADLGQLAMLADSANEAGGFDRLLKLAARCGDAYPWLVEAEAESIAEDLTLLRGTAEAALNAYAEIEQARGRARDRLKLQAGEVRELIVRVESYLWSKPEDFIEAIGALKRQRGALGALTEQPFMDAAELGALDARLAEQQSKVGVRALRFFAEPRAFAALRESLHAKAAAIGAAPSTPALAEPLAGLDQLAESLNGLTELIASFEDTDPAQRAQLLQETSRLYAEVNRQRALAGQRQAQLLEQEQGLEFAAQLTVLEQTQSGLLLRAASPAAVDEALAQLLSQLEVLELRFGAQPRFAAELITRRETVLEALQGKRDQLAAEESARAQALKEAIVRVLEGLPRRLARLNDLAEVHAFFASDPLVARTRSQIDSLRTLGRPVEAEELAARLQQLKDGGLRDLKDRLELGDGETLALGGQRFAIERRPLEVAIVHDAAGLAVQLTGTDYRAPLIDPAADALREHWAQRIPSETPRIARAEWLAYSLLERCRHDATWQQWALTDAPALTEAVSEEALKRPAEDYRRGVHDADAARLLAALVKLDQAAQGLRTAAPSRVLAQLWWAMQPADTQRRLGAEAQALAWLKKRGVPVTLPADWLAGLAEAATVLATPADLEAAAHHLLDSLGREHPAFDSRGAALDAAEQLRAELPPGLAAELAQQPMELQLALWRTLADALPEADAALKLEVAANLALKVPRQRVNADLSARVDGLLGEHPQIDGGALTLDLPEFLDRLGRHAREGLPRFRQWAALRQQLLGRERERLKLDQFLAKPIAGFVRNRLIDQAYLPLIAQNLARQIGTADRPGGDRSGMLLLISPPGYGKTTLMEYLADRLGMIFVRVNGPTLGHTVTGLDPAQADSVAAREELVRLNLGLAMGNNVMLYLDDIQHLSSEFLQKFISLADATRRIDAVVDGQARTLDLRGKRFAVVMAGNPYTETGQRFRIPDMLANRADTYNLGDVLGGAEALFADSYLENAFAQHPLTRSLHERGRDVVAAALALARGEEASLPADLPQQADTVALLRRLGQVRDVLMRVNAAYVASAAQDDAFRSEPPFKLQGSYRNMSRLAPKLSPLLNDAELNALIDDHYRGEAQTLGARAEENLLRLKQLSGALGGDDATRWREICDRYAALMKQGGKEADGATRISQVLSGISVAMDRLVTGEAVRDTARALEGLREQQQQAAAESTAAQRELSQRLAGLMKDWREQQLGVAEQARGSQQELGARIRELAAVVQHGSRGQQELLAQTVSGLRDVLGRIGEAVGREPALTLPPATAAAFDDLSRAYRETLLPLVSAMHHKMTLDHSIWESVRAIRTDLDGVLKRARRE